MRLKPGSLSTRLAVVLVAVACGGDRSPTQPVRNATAIILTGGNNQTGPTGGLLPQALAVRVTDALDAGVGGVTVTFAVTGGGGSLSKGSVTTNPQGVASVQWTLGPVVGSQSAAASAAGLTGSPVAFSATAFQPAPAATITGVISLVTGLLAPPAGGAGTGAVRAEASAPARSMVATARATAPTSELLVRFRPASLGLGVPSLRALASGAQARTMGQAIRTALSRHERPGLVRIAGVSPAILAARVAVSGSRQMDSVRNALLADPRIESAAPLRWLRPDRIGPGLPGTIPNDPNFPNQSWHYAMIGLPRAWRITTGSSAVVVAVVDAGIRFEHPAIGAVGATYQTGGGNILNDGYDFASMGSINLCNTPGGTIDNADDGDGYDPDPTVPDDRDFGSNCVLGSSPVGGHGLHVAGTIGAIGNDGQSVLGVNWAVSIRPIRVLGIDGASEYDVAQGILYAAGLPADDGNGGTVQLPVGAPATRIINLSLGGACPAPGTPDVLHDAVSLANQAGVLMVASAGNGSSAIPSCPAGYPEVISVGAVGPSGHRAYYSNFGPTVDIAAPGGDFVVEGQGDGTFGIFSTTCDFTQVPCVPNQARYQGTSMAAPHVSGVAALLLAQTPGLTAGQVRARLLSYATPLSSTEQLGAGLVNARNSLTQTVGSPAQLYARLHDAATGAVVATQQVTGGQYSFGPLSPGTYLVYAGEDADGDQAIGLPDRRFGAYGGTATPISLTVTAATGFRADFAVGLPGEHESNNTPATANTLAVPGSITGTLSSGDVDVYRLQVSVSGTYTFETFGQGGAFCGFALEVNPRLQLQTAGGSPLQLADDGVGNDFCAWISTTLNPGTYLLLVDVSPNNPLPTPIGRQGRYVLQARAGP